jgi:hypothetical protein
MQWMKNNMASKAIIDMVPKKKKLKKNKTYARLELESNAQ